MRPQLVQNLVHLERGHDGLDQHRGADGALGQAHEPLGLGEHLVPEPGLEMALELGQVEVGAAAPGQQLTGVVVEVEGEVEQARRHRRGRRLARGPHRGASPRGRTTRVASRSPSR